jgi:hypothetical protein
MPSKNPLFKSARVSAFGGPTRRSILPDWEIESKPLQLKHQRRFSNVNADREALDTRIFEKSEDLPGMTLHQAKIGMNGTAQADKPGAHILRLEPRAIQLVMHGRRTEVPEDRLLAAHQLRPARKLVTLPLADFGRGQIANIVDVKDK